MAFGSSGKLCGVVVQGQAKLLADVPVGKAGVQRAVKRAIARPGKRGQVKDFIALYQAAVMTRVDPTQAIYGKV